MSEAICTLFENNYHHGVAALVNSLIKADFEGKVFCGYRGPLPPWAKNATRRQEVYHWKANDSIELVFIPCSPDIHFTNYKPAFMLQLMSVRFKTLANRADCEC
jgi:hypothetical protein